MSTPEPRSMPNVGDVFTSDPITVDMKHIVDFQDFMGHLDRSFSLVDFNHHVNEDFAKQHLYGGVVGDGHQTIAYLHQVVTDHLPAGALVSGGSTFDIRLVNPTRPGDTVVATAEVVAIEPHEAGTVVELKVGATNQREATVAFGVIRAVVPE